MNKYGFREVVLNWWSLRINILNNFEFKIFTFKKKPTS